MLLNRDVEGGKMVGKIFGMPYSTIFISKRNSTNY